MALERSKLGKKLVYASALKLKTSQYVGVLLNLGALLVDRRKYNKAKDLLRLAMEIAQELEERDSGDNDNNSLLVQCLLEYARCIELTTESALEADGYDTENFFTEESLLGIWIDTALTNEKKNQMGGKHHGSSKYYADGSGLRMSARGHSRVSLEMAEEEKAHFHIAYYNIDYRFSFHLILCILNELSYYFLYTNKSPFLSQNTISIF